MRKDSDKKIEKAVFLDFDGVLFDTVKEAYCVAMFAAGRLNSISELSFDSKHFMLFKKYRFLINCAGDYYFLMSLIDKKINDAGVNIERGFKARKNPDLDNALEYEKEFFKKRRYLRDKHYGYWLSLNTAYDFLHDLSPVMRRRGRSFFVITTKDRDSVLRLLKTNKISLPKGNIYDSGSYKRFKSKSKIIRFVKERYFIKNCLFLDDSENHLFTCRGIKGLVPLRAGWGYVSKYDSPLSEKKAVAKIKKFLEVKNVRIRK